MTTNIIKDIQDQTQYEFGTSGIDIFKIDGPASDYGFDLTNDGGIIVWNKQTNAFDILYNVEGLEFSDRSFEKRDGKIVECEPGSHGGDNQAPVAVNDEFNVTLGETSVINVRSNDTDPDGDELTISQINGIDMQPGWATYVENVGVVTVNGDGTVSVESFFTGPYSFEYTISDGKGGSATATVNGVCEHPDGAGNNAPVAVNDAISGAVGETLTVNLLANDSDPDGDALTITQIEGVDMQPGWSTWVDGTGLVTLNDDGSVSIQPADGVKEAWFSYTISDGKGGTATATVDVEVPYEPHQPEKIKIDFEQLATGEKVTNDIDGVTISAIGGSGDAMVFDTANPTGGDSDLANDTQGNVLIISEDGDSSDPDDNARGGTIRFDFDQPSIMDSIAILDTEEGGTINMYGSDGSIIKTVTIPRIGDGETQQVLLDAEGVTRMDVTLNGSGAIDDLCYTPCDEPHDPEPELYGDAVKVCEDESVSFNVLDNDKGSDLKLVSVTHEDPALQQEFEARGGSISFDEDGNVTYQGMGNYYGKDELVYTVVDTNGDTFTQKVDVEVTPVSDAPTAMVSMEFQATPFGSQVNESHVFPHEVKTITTEFFGSFDDSKDELQSFGDLNTGTQNDVDTISAVRIGGANDSGGVWKLDGEVIDPVNQEYVVSWTDIEAGKLTLTASKVVYNTYHLEFQIIDTGTTDGECGGENMSNEDYFNLWTPIALDLNGDGEIGVTGETSSHQKDADAELGQTVEFDIDADGDLDTIEWFDGSGDGILVDISKIGNAENGNFIDGSALFGDEGGKYANGYEKLADRDANGDGAITGDELSGLGLWIDDGDAILEAGELQTADEAGVSSISSEMEIVLDDEGRELMRSEAEVNGETVITEDVWFGGSTSHEGTWSSEADEEVQAQIEMDNNHLQSIEAEAQTVCIH